MQIKRETIPDTSPNRMPSTLAATATHTPYFSFRGGENERNGVGLCFCLFQFGQDIKIVM